MNTIFQEQEIVLLQRKKEDLAAGWDSELEQILHDQNDLDQGDDLHLDLDALAEANLEDGDLMAIAGVREVGEAPEGLSVDGESGIFTQTSTQSTGRLSDLAEGGTNSQPSLATYSTVTTSSRPSISSLSTTPDPGNTRLEETIGASLTSGPGSGQAGGASQVPTRSDIFSANKVYKPSESLSFSFPDTIQEDTSSRGRSKSIADSARSSFAKSCDDLLEKHGLKKYLSRSLDDLENSPSNLNDNDMMQDVDKHATNVSDTLKLQRETSISEHLSHSLTATTDPTLSTPNPGRRGSNSLIQMASMKLLQNEDSKESMEGSLSK